MKYVNLELLIDLNHAGDGEREIKTETGREGEEKGGVHGGGKEGGRERRDEITNVSVYLDMKGQFLPPEH